MEEVSIEELDFDSFFEDADVAIVEEMGIQSGKIDQKPSIYYVEGEDLSQDLNLESLFDGSRVSDILEYTEAHVRGELKEQESRPKTYFENRLDEIRLARDKSRNKIEEINRFERINLADRIQSRAQEISDARTRVYVNRICDMITR